MTTNTSLDGLYTRKPVEVFTRAMKVGPGFGRHLNFFTLEPMSRSLDFRNDTLCFRWIYAKTPDPSGYERWRMRDVRGRRRCTRRTRGLRGAYTRYDACRSDRSTVGKQSVYSTSTVPCMRTGPQAESSHCTAQKPYRRGMRLCPSTRAPAKRTAHPFDEERRKPPSFIGGRPRTTFAPTAGGYTKTTVEGAIDGPRTSALLLPPAAKRVLFESCVSYPTRDASC